jgi:hypothetical protein
VAGGMGWRRIHTRYDRCARSFMSAICIAATVIFWLDQWLLSLDLPIGQAALHQTGRNRFRRISAGLQFFPRHGKSTADAAPGGENAHHMGED